MTDGEFFDLVKKMREAQKRYFRTREIAAVAEAKKLESEVDREIAERTVGPDLF